MGQMMKLLKEKDPTLHKHLVSRPSLLTPTTKFSVDNNINFFACSKRLAWTQPSLDFAGSLYSFLRNFSSLVYKKEIPSIVNVSEIFPFSEVIRIWDSLFADEKRFDFLIFLCAAMIM